MHCKTCGVKMSDRFAKNEGWRLYRRGYTRKQVRDIGPHCHGCMTFWIVSNYRWFGESLSWRQYQSFSE